MCLCVCVCVSELALSGARQKECVGVCVCVPLFGHRSSVSVHVRELTSEMNKGRRLSVPFVCVAMLRPLYV